MSAEKKKMKHSLHLSGRKGLINILGLGQERANSKAECYLTFPHFQKLFIHLLFPAPIAKCPMLGEDKAHIFVLTAFLEFCCSLSQRHLHGSSLPIYTSMLKFKMTGVVSNKSMNQQGHQQMN